MNLKKIAILLPMLAVAIVIILAKCSKSPQVSPITPQIKKSIALSVGDNKDLTVFSRNMGVTSVVVSETDSSNKFQLQLSGIQIILNNVRINFNNNSLEIKKLAGDNEWQITDATKLSNFVFNLATQEGFVTLRKHKFALADYSKQKLNPFETIEFYKLFVSVIEVFEKGELRQTAHEWDVRNQNAPHINGANRLKVNEDAPNSCYRYNYTFGGSKASAEDQAKIDQKDFLDGHKDCTVVGSPDTTCLFGMPLGCLTVVTFTCTGKTCDAVIITE